MNNTLKEISNWRKNNRGLRFGQWLWNAMAEAGKWESPEANRLFFIEDDELVKLLKKHNK